MRNIFRRQTHDNDAWHLKNSTLGELLILLIFVLYLIATVPFSWLRSGLFPRNYYEDLNRFKWFDKPRKWLGKEYVDTYPPHET